MAAPSPGSPGGEADFLMDSRLGGLRDVVEDDGGVGRRSCAHARCSRRLYTGEWNERHYVRWKHGRGRGCPASPINAYRAGSPRAKDPGDGGVWDAVHHPTSAPPIQPSPYLSP